MTAALFLTFVLATAAALLAAMRRILVPRVWAALCAGLGLWLACVGALSWFGVLRDPALRPPGMAFVVGPALLFVVLWAARSAGAGRLAAAVPMRGLIGAQVFRVGVELFLHQLWREGLAPRMLTFEGANLDLWIGASAPLVAWLSTRGRAGRGIAAAWTGLGLLSLANVALRSALTAPGPLHLIDAEVANRAIGTFPFTFIAGFFAPLAATLHVLAWRALRRSAAPGAALRPHPRASKRCRHDPPAHDRPAHDRPARSRAGP